MPEGWAAWWGHAVVGGREVVVGEPWRGPVRAKAAGLAWASRAGVERWRRVGTVFAKFL